MYEFVVLVILPLLVLGLFYSIYWVVSFFFEKITKTIQEGERYPFYSKPLDTHEELLFAHSYSFRFNRFHQDISNLVRISFNDGEFSLGNFQFLLHLIRTNAECKMGFDVLLRTMYESESLSKFRTKTYDAFLDSNCLNPFFV